MRSLQCLAAAAAILFCHHAVAGAPVEISVKSTIDGAEQPCIFIPADAGGARPMLVVVHTWSARYNNSSATDEWTAAATARNWHLLMPEFRGPNKNPDACASRLARQDVIDAADYAMRKWKVDPRRVYIAGGSGGGHMTLVMAAFAPDRWAAASAWVPISDLSAWHRETKTAGRNYWKDCEAVCGGAPGASDAVDTEYRYRSPLFTIHQAKGLPLDINAGIDDGYTGSVPISHSIYAFNAVAIANGHDPVGNEAIARLTNRVIDPTSITVDSDYNRAIHYRQHAGPARLTIFEGGHEMIPEAACAFLEKYARGK